MRSASEARGTPPLRVGVDVGNDVGVKPPRPAASGRDWQGCGACQRSSTRRRRVPHPSPTVAGAAWSRAAGTAGLPASQVASTPGKGDVPWLWSSTVTRRPAPQAGCGAGRSRGVSGRCQTACRWCRQGRWPRCPGGRKGGPPLPRARGDPCAGGARVAPPTAVRAPPSRAV